MSAGLIAPGYLNETSHASSGFDSGKERMATSVRRLLKYDFFFTDKQSKIKHIPGCIEAEFIGYLVLGIYIKITKTNVTLKRSMPRQSTVFLGRKT